MELSEIGNLALRGELYFLRLVGHFPLRLQKVEVERDLERATNVVAVSFKNGQRLKVDEADIESGEFLAKCAMVCDL